MTLSSRNGLAVAELVIYSPALPFSIFLCVRHGFGPNQGWLFLLIFTLIRLVGASLELATIGFPASIPLRTSAALLSSVGLSPLLFTTIGLLIRVCRSINKVHRTFIRALHLKLLRIPIVIALVLVIIGSDNSADHLIKHGTYPIRPISKAGIIVLIATFAVIVLITGIFLLFRSNAEPSERHLLTIVAASFLFVLIRLTYVALTMFSHIRTFDTIYGSVTGVGCMAVMPEMLVVISYIGVGLTLPRVVKEVPVEAEIETGCWWFGMRTVRSERLRRFNNFKERPKGFLRRIRGQKQPVVVNEKVDLENLGSGKATEES